VVMLRIMQIRIKTTNKKHSNQRKNHNWGINQPTISETKKCVSDLWIKKEKTFSF